MNRNNNSKRSVRKNTQPRYSFDDDSLSGVKSNPVVKVKKNTVYVPTNPKITIGGGGRLRKITTIILSVLLILSLCYIAFLANRYRTVGVDAVMDMYNFKNVDGLADNLEHLKKITTSEVYDFNTAENEDVALNTYLKFKGEPVKVIIISKGLGYVVYRLDTKYISSTRKFVLLYGINGFGKINKMRQEEGIDFFNYGDKV